jgi:hypothetical protein
MTPNASKAIEDVYYNLLSAGAYAGPRKYMKLHKSLWIKKDENIKL